MKSLRRFQFFFLLLIGVFLVAAFVINVWVDPWRVIGSRWSSPMLEPYRSVDIAWNRTCKAGLARSGSWDAAIFGSSRVDIQLDPEHPAFKGMPCANLGLNAGSLEENHALFRYYSERQNPRLVVIAVDAADLSNPPPIQSFTDFPLSPLDPDANTLERELRYRAGVSTLAASFSTLSRAIQKKEAEHTPQGFRRRAVFPDQQRQLIASLYLATTHRMAVKHATHERLDPRKVAMMEDIVRRCRELNTRLVIFFTPNHALFQLAFRELSPNDPYFERERCYLADLAARANAAAPASPEVEVWDFLDGHPINSPPLPSADEPGSHLDDWIDIFHATPAVGSKMLDRLEGPGDYGCRLFPENVAERVALVRSQLEDYASRHPADMDFLRQSLSNFQSPPKP